jgi:hypothetical protein
MLAVAWVAGRTPVLRKYVRVAEARVVP